MIPLPHTICPLCTKRTSPLKAKQCWAKKTIHEATAKGGREEGRNTERQILLWVFHPAEFKEPSFILSLFWVMSSLLLLFSLLSARGPCPPQGLCTHSRLCLKHLSPFPYPAPSLPPSLSLIVPSTDRPFKPATGGGFLSSPPSQPPFSLEPFWQCAPIYWLISCQSLPLL